MLRSLLKTFPPTFSKTITVYNELYSPESHSTTWHRTVLDNCFYSCEASQRQEGASIYYADVYNVRIPKNPNYRPPREWIEHPGGCFTLKQGDVIFLGNVDFDIADAEGQRMDDYMKKYKPACFIVQTVKDNTNDAGVLEHYRAMG